MILLGQFLEILIGGLLAGVLYSLVALGFVLIYKASGVFNFAQGAMVLLAGLALVRSLDFLVHRGMPNWAAVLLALLFAGVIMATIVTASASQMFQPRSSSDTKVRAAKNTIEPWAKLNTPEAL